jgi:hypothetical protein
MSFGQVRSAEAYMLVYQRENLPHDNISDRTPKIKQIPSSSESMANKLVISKEAKLPQFSNLMGGTPTIQQNYKPELYSQHMRTVENPDNKFDNKFSNSQTKIGSNSLRDPSKPHPLFGLPITDLKSAPTPSTYLFTNSVPGPFLVPAPESVLKKRPPVTVKYEGSLRKPMSVLSSYSGVRNTVLFQNSRSKLRRFNEYLKRQAIKQASAELANQQASPQLLRVRSAELPQTIPVPERGIGGKPHLSTIGASGEQDSHKIQSNQKYAAQNPEELPLRRSRTVEVAY